MSTRPKLKVKTGCITCRLRKLKCDEEKPFCKRCRASRRKCDGYATSKPTIPPSSVPEDYTEVVPSKHRGQSLSSGLAAHIGPHSSVPLDREESKWFHFFASRTGPSLAPFADDRAFWSEHVSRFALEEPAIRHALLAVALHHAQLEPMHAAADASQLSKYSKHTIKHYNLAVRSLQQAINNRPSRIEVALVCCLLFVILECLYGNYPLALSNLRHGRNILNLPEFHVSKSSEHLLVRKKVEQILTKLLAHSTLFGAQAITSTSHILDDGESLDSTNREPFVDIVDAKSHLDTITSSALQFIKSLFDASGELKHPATAGERCSQKRLRDRLAIWEDRLKLCENTGTGSVSPDDPSVILLKIERQAILIYLSMCESRESPFDVHRPGFVRILSLCRAFQEKKLEEDSPITATISKAFSLYSGYVPALFLTAFKCRDPLLRREAIALLQTYPCREGLWDAPLHAMIARRIVELEEAAMLLFEGADFAAMEEAPSTKMIASNGAVMLKWPLERFRVRNLSRTSEDLARSARVTFVTAPRGVEGGLVVWDEHIEL